jgi:hypothetical protein
MTTNHIFAACLACLGLLTIGCDTAATDDTSSPLAEVDEAGFDPAQADGNLLESHVEVQPGVFMLDTVLDKGDVQLVTPEDLQVDLDDLYLAKAGSDGRFDCISVMPDSYTDSTVNGSLFTGNPKWAGELIAASVHDVRPGLTIQAEMAVISLDQLAPRKILKNDVRGYVWINGEYVGFLYNRATNREGTAALGIFTASCDAGQLDVFVVVQHTMLDIGHPGRLQINRPLYASLQCCPLR